MRRRRTLTLTVTFVAVIGFILASAGPAAAAGTRYVALGDSYSSGVGSGSYLASSGSCLRSTNAYPALWAASHHPASYTSAACSGATTTDVTGSQLGALGAATTLVTISVGGNDVGFARVMQDCVLDGTSTCTREVGVAENDARSTLPGRLDSVYTAIRSRAPNARVVVLGYPRLYHVGVWYCVGLSDTSRSKINEGADVLDGVVRTAAARRGFAFADVRSRFASGHEICDGSSWLHSVDWSDVVQSYHPTASGQRGGYLPALSAVTG
ncbi:MAG: SGNH/GDSL hydrolase family protein [Jatrophihabitantaceae bacterium]